MRQKRKHFVPNRYMIGFLIFLAATVTSTILIAKRNHTDAAPPAKPAAGVPSQLQFTGATNWWQRATFMAPTLLEAVGYIAEQ